MNGHNSRASERYGGGTRTLDGSLNSTGVSSHVDPENSSDIPKQGIGSS